MSLRFLKPRQWKQLVCVCVCVRSVVGCYSVKKHVKGPADVPSKTTVMKPFKLYFKAQPPQYQTLTPLFTLSSF